jgi:tetratricopeptide (TPR) repeat protein
MGQLEERTGDYTAAAREFDQAGSLLPKIDDKRLVARLKVNVGQLAARQSKHENALASFQEAARVFDVADDKKETAEALLLAAVEQDELGNTAACAANLDRAQRMFKELGDLDGQVRVVHRLAAMAERDKKYARARQLLKTAHGLYMELDNTSAAANVERHINALPE